MSFIREFHVIWLLETKTALKFGVPGYNVYLNPSKLNVKRGGIAMLLKCSLEKYVKKIEMSVEGQIWLELSCYPEHMLGGNYIPQEILHILNRHYLGHSYLIPCSIQK